MQLTMYQVDAFASRVFEGNPAAVCPLEKWLPDSILQAIAEENNLAETAFFVPQGSGFHLRWFTPVNEEELCGHATLAAAAVLYDRMGYTGTEACFFTRSGELRVRPSGSTGELCMTFPALTPVPCVPPPSLAEGLGRLPVETLAALDYIAVFASEEEVRAIVPDFTQLGRLDRRGVVVTAPGRNVDFVSRFFAPKNGIPEDPVTGSAHCELAPFWGARLGLSRLAARQLSRRGGGLTCELDGDRVLLIGTAVHYMVASISVPDEIRMHQSAIAGQHAEPASPQVEVAYR